MTFAFLLLVVVVYDHAAEVCRSLQKVLETVVPFSRDFKQEHNALVGEAKLQVACLADVLDQGFSVVDVNLFLFRKVVFAQLLEQDGDVRFLEDDLAHGDKGSAGGLGVFNKVFPGVRVVLFIKNGRNLFGDISGKATHAVAGDESDHVVFERVKVVRLHLF